MVVNQNRWLFLLLNNSEAR